MEKSMVIFAVAIWWRGKRPVNWTLEEHLKNPAVNCTGNEKEMAIRYAELLTQMKEENKMGKDKKDKKEKGEKKDKKNKEAEKAPVPEIETKKDKKEKKGKKAETAPNDTRPTDEMVAAATPAKIVKTIEDALKLDTTPAGDYNIRTPSGLVRARKSEGAGKISWQLDNERITRSSLYNITKSGLTKEEYLAKIDGKVETENEKEVETETKKGKKDKKGKKSKDPIHDDSDSDNGPDSAKLAATYKKKQLLNILKEGQLFKKKIIKAVESEITEKRLTGSEFIAALDTATGTETPVDKINAIFADL